MSIFRVVLTRDTTESVVVDVEADTAEEAEDKACCVEGLAWEPDDYFGEPYMSDVEEL